MTDAADIGHNHGPSLAVARDQLRSIVERIENLEGQRKELGEDVKDIYAEAKGNGYCPKTLRKVVSLRKKDANTRQEEAAILETYMHALGMD